jgi:hypothetical protein
LNSKDPETLATDVNRLQRVAQHVQHLVLEGVIVPHTAIIEEEDILRGATRDKPSLYLSRLPGEKLDCWGLGPPPVATEIFARSDVKSEYKYGHGGKLEVLPLGMTWSSRKFPSLLFRATDPTCLRYFSSTDLQPFTRYALAELARIPFLLLSTVIMRPHPACSGSATTNPSQLQYDTAMVDILGSLPSLKALKLISPVFRLTFDRILEAKGQQLEAIDLNCPGRSYQSAEAWALGMKFDESEELWIQSKCPKLNSFKREVADRWFLNRYQ